MIDPNTEVQIFREIEQLLKTHKDSLLTKVVNTGCNCAANKQKVYINSAASRIGFLLEKLEIQRIGA
jgi:hypothetical protein